MTGHQHRNLPSHAYRTLDRIGLRASRLGFGCYRVEAVSAAHAEALQYALSRGVNLIDTSTNYGDGESEQIVGKVLQEMIGGGQIKREEVVVVSKVGYVQGRNLELAQERERSGAPFPEMVKYMEGCWHCIAPDFLEDQLARSLARLQLDKLDVLLLHNPEYFLSHAKQRHVPLLEARAEYESRIAAAFAFLERKVAEGRIGWYGISSNTFPRPSADPEFTSLEKVWKIAEQLSPNHHFAVIQFPLNLFEGGAVFEKNQREGAQTLLEFTHEHGIATLANRPLNAMTGREMMRLADFETISSERAEEIYPQQLAALAVLEKEFVNELAPQFDFASRLQNIEQLLNWAEQLGGGLQMFRGWGHWDHVQQYIIAPHSERVLHLLRQAAGGNEAWRAWENRYRAALGAMLQTLSAVHSRDAAQRSRQVSAHLERVVPELAACRALSQKALRVLLNTAGLDVVLLGMRRRQYVDDGLEALRAPTISNLTKVYLAWNT